MRVMIAGAGNVGRHLANDLVKRGHEVLVIEQEPTILQRAEAEGDPKVTYMLGDACEPWVLEQAELSSCEVVVAATGDDEDNLVVSLLAKQEHGVPRVVARVNHPENDWMFTQQWGVDVSMSAPHVLTGLVEEAVTVGDLVRLLKLEGGQVTLVELTVAEGSAVVGRPLYELRLPQDSTIVAILRDGHVVIPQPETTIGPGDEIMAIATPENEERLREAILGEGLPPASPVS